MSSKRDYEDVDDSELSAPETKRAKKHSAKSRQQTSNTDANSGQKYVFANSEDATTIPAGEESDFEDDAEAMAYLMSVRRQAGDIPHILVAPKVQIGPQLPETLQDDEEGEAPEDDEQAEPDRSIYMNGTGDSRSYYEDGAYIGLSDDNDQNYGMNGQDTANVSSDLDTTLQQTYYSSILDRFTYMRRILHTPTPRDAHKRLSSSQRTHAPPLGPRSATTKQWSYTMRESDPHPLQVALLSKDSVIRILRVILGGKFMRRGDPLSERTSRWLWALLARLPEQFELNHSEIGWIRDLGRRAVLLGRSLAEMAALREELAENGLGVNDAVDGSSSDEDVVAENFPDEEDGAVSDAESEPSAPQAEDTAKPPSVQQKDDTTAGSDSDDAPMDIESDSDSDEEGEVVENNDDLQAAKQKLLARLNEPVPDVTEEESVEHQLEMNTRATLNMILTVAGELYGQRDLLEFREPFVET